MNKPNPVQLTFGAYGHTLHHCQVISPDNQWIVYDTRNEDSAIGNTTRIERVNAVTKEIEVLYTVSNPTVFGPGVGAVTYSPNKEQVLFIHGLNNASKDFPYAMDRRTGVGINITEPNVPIHFDARDCKFPYTEGALRGGTHSHCWHPSEEIISFTYNDAVLTQNGIPNERVVGVMFPYNLEVADQNDENFSGTHFSVIVSTIRTNAKAGSDEIEKAFDECWVGNKRKIAFQGWVRDENNVLKTEIFIVDLPESLTEEGDFPLKGTDENIPGVPKGVLQKRVTYTPNGISNFRHWLRSSPDGEFVYFLMEDELNTTNIFSVHLATNVIKQVTFHSFSIHSPFNISPDGNLLVYYCNNSLVVYNMIKRSFNLLIDSNYDLYGIPNFDKNGLFVYYNQYVHEDLTSKFLQIFKIQL